MIDLVVRDRAFYLPAQDLWLDPRAHKALAFVSHAHADHIGRHDRIIATPATARLMGRRQGRESEGHLLQFGERLELNDFAATLFSAGHVLGSAQLYVESEAGSLLYTGDFKLRDSLSCDPTTWCHAETLVMETTYGKPGFAFPPSEQVMEETVAFCVDALADGDVPVVVGYSLGKAQEILYILGGAGLPVMCHGAVFSMNEVYRELRSDVPAYEKYSAAEVAGHVLICPPSALRSPMVQRIKNRQTLVLTGWALDPNARFRYGVDAALPLSDHADYPDLLRYVELVNPKRVLAVHGYAREFAADLRRRGIEAWALGMNDQLELSLDSESKAVSVTGVVAQVEREFAVNEIDAFAKVCRALAETPGKLKKVAILSGYLRDLDGADLAAACIFLTGSPFAQVEAKTANAGGAVIRRALALASGLPEAEIRARGRLHRDMGRTVAEVMEGRGRGDTVTLAEVAQFFEKLESTRGPLVKSELLAEQLRALSGPAAEFTVRVLTSGLRIGLKEGLLEEAVAAAFEVPAAQVRAANRLECDVGATALLAKSGRLAEATLRVLRPVRPMLASPEPTAEAIWKRFTGGLLTEAPGLIVEEKFDGIRAQLHADGDRVEIFSRDLKPVSAQFPEIADAFRRAQLRVILDGEIVAFDENQAMSFFHLQRRLGRAGSDFFLGEEIPVRLVVFDVLWLDGRSLIGETLSERRELLDEISLPEVAVTAERFSASSAQEIDVLFDKARERHREGLMIKDPASTYQAGRRGMAWIKLKKAFATLDVVVTGVEWGHGRRRDLLSDYTFAIRDGRTKALMTIGKAYSGLTDMEIARLTEHFLDTTVDERGNFREVEPTVVLEIAFDSVQPSARHASGYALRFPRILRIREDKAVDEIDTLTVVKKLLG